jgi:hypothetical protein
MKEPDIGTIELTLIVDYEFHGVPPEDMEERLRNVVHRAIGEGLITGDTPAIVDKHDVVVEIKSKGEWWARRNEFPEWWDPDAADDEEDEYDEGD